jgi:ADP-ribosylglycohydrolase
MIGSALPPDHTERLERARLALDGLSVGDALGETCFLPENWNAVIDDPRATARAPWPYTDDTTMALAIFEVLDEFGEIHQDALARRFAARYRAAPSRGYGAGAHRLFAQILSGADWRVAAASVFRGGSFGNGFAMRIAPLAAYFADDGYDKVAEQAALASAVTHSHGEGIAGGVAVAVAGAYAWLNRDRRSAEAVKRGLFEARRHHFVSYTPEVEIEAPTAPPLALPSPTRQVRGMVAIVTPG